MNTCDIFHIFCDNLHFFTFFYIFRIGTWGPHVSNLFRPRCWPSAWRMQEFSGTRGWGQSMAGHGRCGATTEVMDVVSYNTLIKAYVRHNLFDQACGLLLTMRPLPSQVNLQKMSEFSGHIIRSECEIQIYWFLLTINWLIDYMFSIDYNMFFLWFLFAVYRKGEDPAHMPNTVTYHELIGALLKTGKEMHRTSSVVVTLDSWVSTQVCNDTQNK